MKECKTYSIKISIRFMSPSFSKNGKWVMFHRGADSLDEAHGIIKEIQSTHGDDFMGASIYKLEEII